MNKKTINQAANLALALVMILGSTIHTQAATSVAQPVEAGPSLYWGALVNGAPSSSNLQPGGLFDTFETRSKKKMSIIHWGEPWVMPDGSWGEFQTSYFDNVRNHGSIPMLGWSSHHLGAGVNQPAFQLQDVYAGTYDTYITRWATAAKNWGHPFFLYFNPEMNGWWYPWAEGKLANGVIVNGNNAGDYVKAWRHVHDIFISVGATNVTWVWGPNHIANNSRYPALSSLYPGDAYVDWTGLSVFNRYPTWLGLNPLLTGQGVTWLKNSYNEVLSVAPNKPMMLPQWGSHEAGDGGAKKAAWITDALTTQIPINFPKIKAVVWFNWDDNQGETFPIETSQAATNAWAAGIGSAVYAANQFANLNTSPIPPLTAITYTLSGNTGVAGVTLHYTNRKPGFAVSDNTGNYSITVPFGWSGTVTPSKPGYAFSPTNRTYSNITANLVAQDYTATVVYSISGNTGVAGATLSYTDGIPKTVMSQANGSYTFRVPSDWSGMVTPTHPCFAFSPASRPYSNLVSDQASQDFLPMLNPNCAEVLVASSGANHGRFGLHAHGSTRTSFNELDSGPIQIVSSNAIPLIAAERVIFNVNGLSTSFSETMALPNSQADTTYWLPWYNNVDLDTQLRFANLRSDQPATVHVWIAGQEVSDSPFLLPPGEATRISLQGINGGPVKIESDHGVPIVAAERVIFNVNGVGTSFSEMMALPNSLIDTTYWLPWYNNVDLDTQLRFANLRSDQPATVHVWIAGQEVSDSPFLLPPGEATRISLQGINGGPVKIESDHGVPIVAAERVIFNVNGVGTSFSEMMALPNSLIDTTYWLPWYNNVDLDTQLRFGVP